MCVPPEVVVIWIELGTKYFPYSLEETEITPIVEFGPVGKNLFGTSVLSKKLSYKGPSTAPINTFPDSSYPGTSTG